MKSKIQINERELLKRHPRDYRIQELNHLIGIYQKKLYKAAYYFFGNREDAQDIVQETLYIGLSTIDSFKGYSSYYTWLYSIFLNISKKWRRRKLKRLFIHENESFHIDIDYIEQSDDPIENLEKREKMSLINKVMKELPEKYRAVMVMRHLEEMNYKEISEVLKCSLGTVKTRIHKGRIILRKKLEKYYA